MNNIKWNSDEGIQYLNKMDSTINDIRENLAKVRQIVNLDQNIWSGITRESFSRSLSEQEQVIRNCIADVEAFVKYLDNNYTKRNTQLSELTSKTKSLID